MTAEPKMDTLRHCLMELEEGATVVVPLDKDKVRALDYLYIKQRSIQSLFRMLMIEDTEIVNSVNAQKVLEMYAETEREYQTLLNDLILSAVGKDNYFYMNEEGLFWRIDPVLNCLTIGRPMRNQYNNEERNGCPNQCS